MSDLLTRSLLLAPTRVTRAAAARVGDPQQRWMLGQPRPVRASYVREVLQRGEDDVHREIWMLRQPDEVRESYIRDVLGRGLPGADGPEPH